MCQNVKNDVKLSKSCQMSKNVKHLDCGGGSENKKIYIMRFTHIEINFDVRHKGHKNWSKILSMEILRVFGEHHM